MSGIAHSAGAETTAAEIVERIRAGGPALIALSGGVDSGVVAHLAYRALGERAVAVTVTGPAVAPSELAAARSLARAVGLPHALVAADPLSRSEYRANPSNRCYFCREVEGAALRAYAERAGLTQWLDGIHLDDLGEVRPGLAAMEAAGFGHPLAEARWGKARVRRYAAEMRLPNAARPSNACLASRVAHGVPISAELLERLDRAETYLADRGFARVRVRYRGRGCRIEVDPSEVARLTAPPLADEVRAELERLGLGPVEFDPDGYRPPRRG